VPGIRRSDEMVRFEGFKLDLRTGELRKDGDTTVRFSEQPLRILIALLERPGELVLREDLRKLLWPNDTIVEFEHSISAAINRLRQALGDSADNPRFIETLARRGYRWKTPVEWMEAAPEVSMPSTPTPSQSLIGKRVAHYRVLEVLGGGGMGLVYKAEDLKLGRRVALKFLPEELAADPVALERFRREARAASGSDHASICTIYEVGEYEGAPFIAMQLLQGQTLSERIEASARNSPAMPLDELLALALQVADGLGAAHCQGIIHRDIKPANIFVTERGEAKILDFGLAKLVDVAENEGTLAGPTVPHGGAPSSSLNLTRAGTALGTASYMSPEQVRGEKLDARTDLFSFGLVLYEMSTAQRAFAGDSASEVHDAVLHRMAPAVRTLNPKLPLALEVVIEKALQKDRESRYQSATELCSDLEELRKEITSPRLDRRERLTMGVRFSRPLLSVGGLLVILLVAVIFRIIWPGSSPAAELKLTQLTWNSSEIPVRTAALSPDGKYLAYTDFNGIHIKILSTNETRTVPEPDSIQDSRVDWAVISWLPDGTRFIAEIAPFDEGCLGCDSFSTWVVSVLGGSPHKIHDKSAAESVSPDGKLVAFTAILGKPGGKEIWVMDPAGEHSRRLFETDQNSWMRYARWSPDGQRLAYVHVHETPGRRSTLESRPLSGGDPVAILTNADAVHDYVWLPDGNVIYGLDEGAGNACNYWKLKVDTRTGRPSGQPHKVTHWAGFCLDATSATADGKRLAFTERTEQRAIYVAQMQSGGTAITTPKRLSLIEGSNWPSGWTSDSKSVIFASNSPGGTGFYKQALDSDTAEPILTGLADTRGPAVSPDGKWILYIGNDDKQDPSALQQVFRVSVAGGPAEPILSGRLWGIHCARLPSDLCVLKEWSSDSKQIVFSALDPIYGRGRELIRMNARDDSNWELSPDGTRIALFGVDAPIRILTLSDRSTRDVVAKRWKNIDDVSWAADSKGLYGSSPTRRGAILLHMNPEGKVHVIWDYRGGLTVTGIPSPDGHYLSIEAWSLSSNVWMMEKF